MLNKKREVSPAKQSSLKKENSILEYLEEPMLLRSGTEVSNNS